MCQSRGPFLVVSFGFHGIRPKQGTLENTNRRSSKLEARSSGRCHSPWRLAPACRRKSAEPATREPTSPAAPEGESAVRDLTGNLGEPTDLFGVPKSSEANPFPIISPASSKLFSRAGASCRRRGRLLTHSHFKRFSELVHACIETKFAPHSRSLAGSNLVQNNWQCQAKPQRRAQR